MPTTGMNSFFSSPFRLFIIAFSIAGLLGLNGCSGCSRPEEEEEEAATSPITEDPSTPETPTSPETFGVNGIVTTDIADEDKAYAMAIQSDGKILVAGFSLVAGYYDFSLVRYNTDGSLDTSFGTGGKVTTSIGTYSLEYATAMTIQSDGKILLAGRGDWTLGPDHDFTVIRYNTDGSLDTGFGTGGIVTTDIGTNSEDLVEAIAIQSDGKILVAGSQSTTGGSPWLNYDFAVVRYNADGSLDTSFGTGGKVTTDIGTGISDQAYDMSIQSDGKILVAGQSTATGNPDFTLVRYNTDGSLDTGFGTAGKVSTDIGTGSRDYAYTISLQSNGKILVAGYSDASGSTYDFALVRYNTDGTLDTGFGTSGKVITDIDAGSYEEANSLTIQSDGKILATGYSVGTGTVDFALVRYNTDGSLDTSFGGSGKVTTDLGGNDDEAFAITLQNDGKILVAGYSDASGGSYDFVLVRYNTDGSK